MATPCSSPTRWPRCRAVRRPDGRCGARATSGSRTATGVLSRLQNIEYVVGFNIDRRVQDVTGRRSPPCPARVGSFRTRALLRRGRDQRRHARRGHGPDDRTGPGRVARGLRGQPARAWTEAPATLGAAVAAALPVELRDHAVAVEAPARRRRAGRPGTSAGVGLGTDRPVPDHPAAAGAAGRHVPGLRAGVPRPGRHGGSRGAGCCSSQLLLGAVAFRLEREPARRAVAAARAAAGLPAADVRGAHPVRRDARSPGSRCAGRRSPASATSAGYRRPRPAS